MVSEINIIKKKENIPKYGLMSYKLINKNKIRVSEYKILMTSNYIKKIIIRFIQEID